MERVQAPQHSSEGADVPSLAPFPAVPAADQGLERLALVARSTPGQAGLDALQALQRALATLPRTEENARLLLRLLDEGAFNDLLADDGTPAREHAVEALLSLGYPWALQVHPDELAWYRRSLFLRARNRILSLLAVGAAAALAEALLFRLF